jgi:hypothetical protein
MPDKIQQEIEDLLSRLDTFPPPKPWYVRVRESVANTLRGVVEALGRIPVPRLNTGYVALAAIFVAVMAYFLYDDLGNFAAWIIIGAILAFIVAFVLSLRRTTRPPTKYWRDRPMDLNKPGPDWRNRRRR